MKKILCSIVVCTIILGIQAQDKVINGSFSVNGNAVIDNNVSSHSNIRFGHESNDRIIVDNSSSKGYGGGYFFRVHNESQGSHKYIDAMMLADQGRLGIGTKVPSGKLEVNGTAVIDNKVSSHSNIRFGHESNDRIIVDNSSSKGYGGGYFFRVHNESQGSHKYIDAMMLTDQGYLGIGTKVPSGKLEVNGTAVFDDKDSSYSSIRFGHESNDRIIVDNSPGKGYGGGYFFRVHNESQGSHKYIDAMMLTDKGSLGIGTKITGNHKLAVEGSIAAREVKVQASGWSDFVFEEAYALPTLSAVEQYIKAKGHLKDIPSAKEVTEHGIHLGAMDAKLLQKIEELTLYTIAQEKKISQLEKDTKMIQVLSERLAKMEAKFNLKK